MKRQEAVSEWTFEGGPRTFLESVGSDGGTVIGTTHLSCVRRHCLKSGGTAIAFLFIRPELFARGFYVSLGKMKTKGYKTEDNMGLSRWRARIFDMITR